MSDSQNHLKIYQPSERLKAAQQELLEHYPLEEIIKTLRMLSRSMSAGELAYEDGLANKHERADMVEARTMAIIGDDLLEVCNLIQTINANEPLERDLSGSEGNADLKLFEGKSRKVPDVLQKLTDRPRTRELSPLERCIVVTRKWCRKQEELVDIQATELALHAGGSNPEDLAALTKRLELLDNAGGMLHYLEVWAKVAIQEVNKARKLERGGESSQGVA